MHVLDLAAALRPLVLLIVVIHHDVGMYIGHSFVGNTAAVCRTEIWHSLQFAA